jgi:hypothetical protein
MLISFHIRSSCRLTIRQSGRGRAARRPHPPPPPPPPAVPPRPPPRPPPAAAPPRPPPPAPGSSPKGICGGVSASGRGARSGPAHQHRSSTDRSSCPSRPIRRRMRPRMQLSDCCDGRGSPRWAAGAGLGRTYHPAARMSRRLPNVGRWSATWSKFKFI